MYIVMNELHVTPEQKPPLRDRFKKAADNMAYIPGCLEFMFLANENQEHKEIVFTKWASKEDYENWLSSEAFTKAHKGSSQNGKQTVSTNELHAYSVVHHYKGE